MEREWEQQFAKIDAAIGSQGQFDLHGYTGVPPDPSELDDWTVYVAGHLIEVLFVGDEPTIVSNPKFHHFVSWSIEQCLKLDVWGEPEALLRGARPFDYASACHLVHGLKLYREACVATGLVPPE